MGKLLNSVLNSILIASVKGQAASTDYELTSCNLNDDPTQVCTLKSRSSVDRNHDRLSPDGICKADNKVPWECGLGPISLTVRI